MGWFWRGSRKKAGPKIVQADRGGMAAGRDINNNGLDEGAVRQAFKEELEFARQNGVFGRAAQSGISEAAVRKIVLRLGGEGLTRDDLVPWLDNWIEAAQRQLAQHTNEDEAFEAARLEAERRWQAGAENPSSALMDELAREQQAQKERQAESRRRQLRILEEAIRIDELVLDIGPLIAKLRQMAGLEERNPGEYLFEKAGKYYERGDQKGGNTALLAAIAAYRAALEEWTRERVPLDWARTQNNLANALTTLGERERGTAHLERAVTAYRCALMEWTAKAAPYWHDVAQKNWAGVFCCLTNAVNLKCARASRSPRN